MRPGMIFFCNEDPASDVRGPHFIRAYERSLAVRSAQKDTTAFAFRQAICSPPDGPCSALSPIVPEVLTSRAAPLHAIIVILPTCTLSVSLLRAAAARVSLMIPFRVISLSCRIVFLSRKTRLYKINAVSGHFVTVIFLKGIYTNDYTNK